MCNTVFTDSNTVFTNCYSTNYLFLMKNHSLLHYLLAVGPRYCSAVMVCNSGRRQFAIGIDDLMSSRVFVDQGLL